MKLKIRGLIAARRALPNNEPGIAEPFKMVTKPSDFFNLFGGLSYFRVCGASVGRLTRVNGEVAICAFAQGQFPRHCPTK